MGKRDTRTVRTAYRRLAGHVSTGPTGVADQSRAAMSRPASPPGANRSPASGRGGKPGAAPMSRSPPAQYAGTSSDAAPDGQPASAGLLGARGEATSATCEPAKRTRSRGSDALDHVVDAGGQRRDVVGVDGREHADPQLVAAQLAVGLGVDDAVRAEDLGDGGGVERLGEVDGADAHRTLLRVGHERGGVLRLLRPAGEPTRRLAGALDGAGQAAEGVQ